MSRAVSDLVAGELLQMAGGLDSSERGLQLYTHKVGDSMTWLELHCSCPVLPQDGHPLLQQLQERLPPLLLPLPAPGRPGRDLRPGAGHRLPDSGRHAGLRGKLRAAGDHP